MPKNNFSYTVNEYSITQAGDTMKTNKDVGINTYLLLQQVEREANKLGFAFGRPNHGGYDWDYISLYPLGNDGLPIYSRDARLYTGTLAEIESWLKGVVWARDYDRMLKVSDPKKRERKEQDERNRLLAHILTQEVHNEQ